VTSAHIYLAVVVLLAACPQERAEQELGATTQAAQVAQEPAFRGTTGVTERRRPAAPPALAQAATADSLPGHDRVVFQFATDSLPGYHIAYATRPVVRCGSGDPVTVAGQARLVVRFEPARAHDDRGNVTIARREWTPGLLAVKEVKLVCDFEGQVEWVLGVDSMRPYRVTQASAPARLILDVGHTP
jgi:hypothetical protein